MLPERVQTQQLTLRTWTAADLDPLAKIFAVKAVWQFPFDRGLTREETTAFLERQRESWRIEVRACHETLPRARFACGNGRRGAGPCAGSLIAWWWPRSRPFRFVEEHGDATVERSRCYEAKPLVGTGREDG